MSKAVIYRSEVSALFPRDRFEIEDEKTVKRISSMREDQLCAFVGAVNAAHAYFNNDRLRLSLLIEPEESGEGELTLEITTRLSPQQAAIRIDGFFNEYWFDFVSKQDFWVGLTVDFE